MLIIEIVLIWLFFTALLAFTYVEVHTEQSWLKTWWRFLTFRIYPYD